MTRQRNSESKISIRRIIHNIPTRNVDITTRGYIAHQFINCKKYTVVQEEENENKTKENNIENAHTTQK